MPGYKKISDKMQQLTINNPATKNKIDWLNITDAGKKEIEYLRKKYRFEIDHLRSSLSTVFSQRPIVLEGPNYLFVILHFPIIKNNTVIAGEIEFFIGHGFLITIHNNNVKSLNDFFNLCKKDQESLLSYKSESSIVLLYEILNKLIKDCYQIIDSNSLNISLIEEKMFGTDYDGITESILKLRRNIVNLRKILQNHKNILKKLTETQSSLVPVHEIKDYYNELIEHSKRIWEMLDNQKEMIEAINDTNECLINNRMTGIMKALTIVTVLLYPLGLLASVFGMNTTHNMPFMNDEYGFWKVLALMAIVTTSMLLIFWKKKWLK